MDSISEVAKQLESEGYRVLVQSENVMLIPHPSLPIRLRVEFKEPLAYVTVEFEKEELREILEDLHEAGEDIESVVEEALGYLNAAALKLRKWLEEKGYAMMLKLREGSIEIYELLEELEEELAEE